MTLLPHILLVTACATGSPGAAVNAAVPSHGARLITTGYEGARFLGAYVKSVEVALRNGSDEFLVHAGSYGTIAIPYASISYLSYGPSARPGREGGGGIYRWSGRRHHYDRHYLKIGFQPPKAAEATVVLALGKDLVHPILALLERRSSKKVGFGALEACRAYRTPDDCGVGALSDLKNLSAVFVDTSGSSEWVDGESYTRISTVINEAGAGLRLVGSAQNADIILRFCYNAGTKPGFLSTGYNIRDRAVGEVYVVRPDGVRVLITFDEALSGFNTKLAQQFARAFVRQYQQANR